MDGASKDLMYACMKALKKAHDGMVSLRCDRAVDCVSNGKSDTYGLDQATEEVIKHSIADYDKDLVLITEETGKAYHGERGLEPTRTILISDPTDRSIIMKKFLDKQIAEDDSKKKKYVGEILEQGMGKWKTELGDPVLSGASGSITAIKDRRILFNVMVNYITGHMFVSSPLGNRYGTTDDLYQMSPVNFSPDAEGDGFATFLGKTGYEENLEKCDIGVNKDKCIDPWAPGPTRILQLSDIYKQKDAGFILANGEKIGEWIGWLSWVKYAKDSHEPDENALQAFRIFFECPRTREYVSVAPAPHYSIFRDEGDETRITPVKILQHRASADKGCKRP
ncbi:MAG: hypothetical protein NT120_04785 [Candidatus Aenigmarchaeota archaeon]|nr:hypothetical protein [Candidatus Aenigmarchaeota archaeon]